MAKMKVTGFDGFEKKLNTLSADLEGKVIKATIYDGAAIIADEIRSRIEALPFDKWRYLHKGDAFSGISNTNKQDLLNGLGIAPIGRNTSGEYDTNVGFDGYGSVPTKAYPKGLPNQLLARAIESGSSVRSANPFVRKAYNAVKSKAQEQMTKTAKKEIDKLVD